MYRWLLLLSVLFVLVVVVLAFLPGPGESIRQAGTPGPAVLGWLLATVLLAMAGGLVALVVIPMVLVGRRWPKALPWLGATSLLIAGVIAAVQQGLGAPSQTGAFGGPAQVLALTAVGAALLAPSGTVAGAVPPPDATGSPGRAAARSPRRFRSWVG